ncbi:UbiA family prenyltransferase [Candidatus Pelagibacter sp.]|uniref:UbiA family prenyltransferase n=1 Tax=Candidatus Pelagibacter sp. TaxID=2024849 RepID=UPI003F877EEF
MEKLKNWMIDSANILFDDSKNDLRSLPRSVRLQILLVLSFIWTTVFSLYIFSYTTFAFGWAGLFIAHIGLIFAVYMTFKQFHRAEAQSASVFKAKNYDPFKIMIIVFVIVFIFVFSKGIEVLNNTNSYTIKYDGPDKTAEEKWLPFTKKKKDK